VAKSVIVTGGSGFVGANLVRRLLKEGHQLHLLVRPESDLWRIKDISKEIKINRIHLSDQSSVKEFIAQTKPDWIFHLAVNGAYSWQNNPFDMINSNIIGTATLLDACLENGFEAFVNTGSSSEYGHKDHGPSEEEALEPNSYYAVTKAAATMYCRYVAQSRQLHVPTLRLYSVYGPYEDPKRLMPTLAVKGLNKQLPPLVNPTIARDYIYIDDVIDVYLRIASMQATDFGAIYNVGTGKQTSIREIVDIACKVLNIEEKPCWGSMNNRSWDTSTWVADNRKLVHTLNWQPRFDLEKGFAATVEWFRKSPDMLGYYQIFNAPISVA
jgi:nucleoside-diphosphate-sugar epimerase